MTEHVSDLTSFDGTRLAVSIRGEASSSGPCRR